MKKISLGCHSLSLANVSAMEQVLAADDPLTVLYQDLSESILEHHHSRLAGSKFYLFNPAVAGDDNAVVEDSWSRGLRVLGSVGGEWWIVLLPGWGKAWVHANEAQLSPATKAENEAAKPGVRAIELLQLDAPRDAAATAALLRLVGENLTRLVVHELSDLSERWCTEILRSSPELQELHLFGIMGNGVTAVASRDPGIAASKLERSFFNLEYIEGANLTALATAFEALGDQHHPALKHLRTFGFEAPRVVFGQDMITSTEIFTHACQMLQGNKTLERFRLDLPITVQSQEMTTAIRAAFARYHGEQLPIWANHIPVRDKAAFLSVLRSPSSSDAMRALDRGVIANILDFMPEPSFRSIHFVLA